MMFKIIKEHFKRKPHKNVRFSFLYIQLNKLFRKMKKFSNITNQKVNEEPKVQISKEEQAVLELKSHIKFLLDNLLTIRSNGSARQELLNNSISISGKDLFIEALVDLLSKKTINESIKTLESLKGVSTDWLTIDNKMNELHKSFENKETLISNQSQVKKIVAFLETYGDDKSFDVILENYVNRIKNPKEAYLRSLIANKMMNDVNYSKYSKKQLSKISEKFLFRSKNII